MKKITLVLMSLLLVNHIYSQEETTPPVTENTQRQELEAQMLEQWTKTIQYGISSQRLAIVKKIRGDKISNALTLLETTFPQENNNVVKEEIIYTFIDMNYSNNTQFWNDIFANEQNLIVLQRAAYAVELMSIPIAPAIFTALSNRLPDPKAMRFNASAVQALGKLKAPEALPIITELATNITNHQDLRSASVVALGMYQDETLIPLLESFLTNTTESRVIRRYAALAIGRTENPQAITILTPIATNEQEDQTIRLNSIAGLGYVGNEELIPTLESLTKSDDTAIRTEAIKSLGKMKAKSTQEILEYKVFNDPEAIVRREAKKALQEMGVDIDNLEKERRNN